MKKQRKSKHIPTTNNPSDYNRLLFRLFSLQASRLDKLGRYHKRRLKKTLKLMKAEHFAGTLYLSGFPCSTCSHQRFEFRCPRFPSCKHKKKKMFGVRLRCCLRFVFLSLRQTEQTEKRAGVRMTHSFRKAVMSVNMSHNGDLFTDTLPNQKETHRWYLSALPCITSQRCLFLMGIRSTERVWLMCVLFN